MKKVPIEERFWKYVNKTDYCWEWVGCVGKRGYGVISRNCATRTAHRVSYEINIGIIPAGMCVCHKCDNKLCVNPDHLWLGTLQDNIADMIKKGRNARIKVAKGEDHHSAKLTNKDVIEIRELRKSSNLSQREIAKMYGVTRPMIGYIERRKSWTHI